MGRRILFNVQLLRFVAAFAILFTHTLSVVIPASPLIGAIPWVGGVDIFFIISGFIMTWMTNGQFGSPAAALDFLKRRVIRVVPPYWFFTLVTAAAILLAGGRIKNTTAGPREVATSLAFIPWPRVDGAMVPILPQGWTLNYEAFFYLAFAACMLHRRGLWVLVGGFILLAGSAALIPDRLFVVRFFADPIILEFVAGIALGKAYLAGVRLAPIASAALIAAAIAAYATLPDTDPVFYRAVHLGIPAALIGAALILGREPARLGLLGRAIKGGGDASYTLYLSHKLSVPAAIMACGLLGLRGNAAVAAIAIVSAIAFAVLFYRFAEAPFLAWLARRSKVRGGQVAAAVAP